MLDLTQFVQDIDEQAHTHSQVVLRQQRGVSQQKPVTKLVMNMGLPENDWIAN